MITSEAKLVVRLSEAEKRYIKSMAARQGLTLRRAMLQAFKTWELLLQSRALATDPAPGTPAGPDSQKLGQGVPAVTPRQDRRRPGEEPPSAPDGGSIPSFSAASQALLQRAAHVDWSKCPAVERVRGKTGKVWMVRGTDAPLAEIMQSVADGQPFLEIAEVFEITLQQLLAVLQFAATTRPG